ncbi:MAG: signal peptidase II [Gammaproteobacteria bacterium]
MSDAPKLPPVGESGWRWLPMSALLIIADQVSKGWIEARYLLGESTPVLPVLDIVRLHNPGAAFSFLAGAGGWQRWFLSALAIVVSVGILWWLRQMHAGRERMLAVSFALILAGAIGNVIDRIEHGYVVDFIHAHWGGAYFPAFYIADMAISVGAGLMLLDAFLDWRRGRAASRDGSGQGAP